MPEFPGKDQIAALKVERHVIDGEEFVLVTILLQETEWFRTTSLDAHVLARRWGDRSVEVGMKDAQGRCRCWLELPFALDAANYDARRLRRRAQRWTVQLSLEAYWEGIYMSKSPPFVDAPTAGEVGGLVLHGSGFFGLAHTMFPFEAVLGAPGAVLIVGAGAFLLTTWLGDALGILPEAREFVDESWVFDDETLLSAPRNEVALWTEVLRAASEGALGAGGAWNDKIAVPGLSLELTLRDSAQGTEERAARVTETWPCGERWLPADLPRGRWLESVRPIQGPQFVRRALPTHLSEIPPLYATHSLAALRAMMADPCCGTPKVQTPADTEAPEVEAPKTEVPKVEAPNVEAPKVEVPKVEVPQRAALDSVERLPPELAAALLRRGLGTLSATLAAEDAALIAGGVSRAGLNELREQIRLLLAWPKALAGDCAIVVVCMRETAANLSNASKVLALADRVERSSPSAWRRTLARLELKEEPRAETFAASLRAWVR